MSTFINSSKTSAASFQNLSKTNPTASWDDSMLAWDDGTLWDQVGLTYSSPSKNSASFNNQSKN